MKISNIFFFSLFFLFMSCSSAQVATDRAPQAALSSYQTYAFLPSKSDLSVSERNYDKSAVIRAMEEINDEMKALGYELDLENPQLLVKTYIASRQQEDVQAEQVQNSYNYNEQSFQIAADYPHYYEGYQDIGEVDGEQVETVDFQQNAVIVDLIDASTHKIVWRGWAKDKGDVEDIKNNL